MNKTEEIITILGCGGFIGSHLIDRLLSLKKFRIYGIDKNASKIESFMSNDRFEFIKSSIYGNSEVISCIEKSSIVISLAALCNPSLYNTIPIEVIESNFIQPVEMVKLCNDMGKWMIHFSTSEVYGKTISSVNNSECTNKETILFKEDSTPLILGAVESQRWSYACAKQLLERLIYAYGFQKGLSYTIIRPFNFIGSNMDFIPGIDGEGIPRVLACFMDSLLFRKPLKVVDGGNNKRVFTFIDDAIDALIHVMNNKESVQGQILNVGNPENEISIIDLAYLMIRIYKEMYPEFSDYEYSVQYVSAEEFYGKGYDDSDRRVPDISKITTFTGWLPRTDLETALKHSVAAYVNQYLELKPVL